MTETRAVYNVGLRMPRPDVVLMVSVGRPWRCATGQHVLGRYCARRVCVGSSWRLAT